MLRMAAAVWVRRSSPGDGTTTTSVQMWSGISTESMCLAA